MNKLYCITTGQGTAIPESTLCEVHHRSPECRETAREAAKVSADVTLERLAAGWHECTGNECCACIYC